jgi:hypothetical protein
MTQATLNRKEWIEATVAARALGIGLPTLSRVAPHLGIKVRIIPQRKGPRYNRADVEAAVARLEAQEAATVAAAQQSFGLPTERSGRSRAEKRTARTMTM